MLIMDDMEDAAEEAEAEAAPEDVVIGEEKDVAPPPPPRAEAMEEDGDEDSKDGGSILTRLGKVRRYHTLSTNTPHSLLPLSHAASLRIYKNTALTMAACAWLLLRHLFLRSRP